jgi:hypothetical protein
MKVQQRGPEKFPKMEPGFKKRWVEALRTPPDRGGYLQTTGALYGKARYGGKQVDAFCCLGVAFNLLALDGVVAWNPAIEKEGVLLSFNTLLHIGLSERAQGTLTDLNDTYRNTFNQIADFIEGNL